MFARICKDINQYPANKLFFSEQDTKGYKTICDCFSLYRNSKTI